MKKCIVLKKHGTYETYFSFAASLADSFKNMHVIEIEFNNFPINSSFNERPFQELIDSLDASIHFVLSLNGYGNDIFLEDNTSIFDYFNIPLISFMVDDPMWIGDAAAIRFENQIFTCIDYRHVEILKNAYGQKAFFVPHGGSEASDYRQIDFHQRDIDVLFSGTYIDIEKFKHISSEKTSANVNSLFDCIVEEMLRDETLSYYDAVCDCALNKLNIVLEKENQKKFLKLFRNAQEYVRYSQRQQIMQVLLDAGINIECYGQSWNTSPFTAYKNFIHRPSVHYGDILSLMNRSKVILNCSPTLTHGSHERVFSAMLNGGVAATNKSIFLNEILEDMEDVLFYTSDNLQLLPDKIQKIIHQPTVFEKYQTTQEIMPRPPLHGKMWHSHY